MLRRTRHRPAQRQLELSLQQARYEAAHARRQYDAVDPANRLVAGELERRWNEARQVVHRIEGEIAAIEARKPVPLSEVGRQQLMQPGADPRTRLVASGDNVGDTQSRRQADGTGNGWTQARVYSFPQPPRHYRPSRKGMGRAE
jgi:hypothetical protein